LVDLFYASITYAGCVCAGWRVRDSTGVRRVRGPRRTDAEPDQHVGIDPSTGIHTGQSETASVCRDSRDATENTVTHRADPGIGSTVSQSGRSVIIGCQFFFWSPRDRSDHSPVLPVQT